MYKSLVVLCVLCSVIVDARPSWQFLPPKAGYVPVYIRPGDTPLEDINPELAEAFHALPIGRSAGKEVEASPDLPDSKEDNQPEQVKSEEMQSDQPAAPEDEKEKIPVESPEDSIDRRPYEKKVLEKKTKKVNDITKPVERR